MTSMKSWMSLKFDQIGLGNAGLVAIERLKKKHIFIMGAMLRPV